VLAIIFLAHQVLSPVRSLLCPAGCRHWILFSRPDCCLGYFLFYAVKQIDFCYCSFCSSSSCGKAQDPFFLCSCVKFCFSGVLSISHSNHASISYVVGGFSSAGSFSPVHLDLWYRLPAVESLGAAFMKENTIYVVLLDFAG
jgi:hypothetical protein